MGTQSTLARFGVLVAAAFLFSPFLSNVRAAPATPGGTRWRYRDLLETIEDQRKGLSEKAEEGVRVIGTRYYWDEGFHIHTRRENIKLKIGGSMIIDAGYIGANDELGRAFPDLEGPNVEFRRLSVSLEGTIRALKALARPADTTRDRRRPVMDTVTSYAKYDALEFKFEIDFANVSDIMDNWIRFPSIPFLRNMRFGHIKEPFSLERLDSLKNITFMEVALPTRAFAPGRDIGMRYDNAVLDERMTVGAGAFLNTGSFGDFGEGQDQLSEANGYNLTARVTGLPWYADEGERLVHLGLSYSHGFRADKVEFRTRPESRLSDDRLVDTGERVVDGQDLINPEFAAVLGPLSLQGEYFHAFVDAKDDPQFWGFYVYGSYFLTGEHRSYDTKQGVFSRLRPKHNFRLLKGGWGAWELGFRYSYIDLNDEGIKGGKEGNFTAGLNWYLTPHTRFMFNYIRARVKDRAVPPPVEDGVADIVMGRFQIDF